MVSDSDMNSIVYMLAYKKYPVGVWSIIDNPFIMNENKALSGEMITSQWYKSILKHNDSIEYIIFKITKAHYNAIVANDNYRTKLIENITTTLGCRENNMVVMRHKINSEYINSLIPKLKDNMKSKNNQTSTINTIMTNNYGEFSMTFGMDIHYNLHLYCPQFNISI